jgi:hypothetical protein
MRYIVQKYQPRTRLDEVLAMKAYNIGCRSTC